MTAQTLLEDAQKLTGDGIVMLYQLTLKNGTIFRFKNNDTVTWQGSVWNGIPCQMTGEQRNADDEQSRPALSIANPEGIFSKAAFDGLLESGIVRRREILRKHLDANLDITVDRMWYVGRVPELVRGKALTLELRNMTDGPNFKLPIRQYLPPEFPVVSL